MDVNEYALSTAFNATTAVFVDDTSISGQDNTPTGMAFSSDGAKMFVIGNQNDAVNEYALTTTFDASTRTFVHAADVSQEEPGPQDVAFSSDGSKMFVIGASSDDVNEYALSSVYPITVVASAPPPDAFVTTWETTGANQAITIPATGTYSIDWGDGATVNATASGTQTHDYTSAGQPHRRHHRRAGEHQHKQPPLPGREGQAPVHRPVGEHNLDHDGRRVPRGIQHGIRRRRYAGPLRGRLHELHVP